MLAVFKTGGKQYSVKTGQILKVEKLEGIKGDSISFNNVLAVSEQSNHTIGSPLVEGASIEAKILDQIRDKKIIVFKKRQRQNYRHTQGHRQYLTVLQIESIEFGNKKSTATPKKVSKKILENKESNIKESALKKKTVTKKTIKKKVVSKKKTTKKIDKDK
jgi:large subunit ribosomal protein L21